MLIQDCTDLILDILSEDPQKTWIQSTLCDEVQNRKKMNTSYPPLVLKALICCGRVHGTFRNENAVGVRHKVANDEEQAATMRAANAEITRLADELRAAKSAMGTDQTELLKSLAEANDKAKRFEDLNVQVGQSLKIVAEKLAKAEDAATKAGIFEIRLPDPTKETGAHTTTGLFHQQFKRILKLAAARMNIFIYGPMGSGKSHICEQIAQALGLDFAFVSCTNGMSESHLAGRLMPVGADGQWCYVMSEFVRCYENGGVFLIDEIDAADPNVLLIINSALANGRLAVSNRPEKPYAIKHPDFVCIAAANTLGLGADRMYSGRNKLDASTLDRFGIGKVRIDYDTNVEKSLCPDEELRAMLYTWRDKINAHRMERAVSTRFMRDAYKMVHGQPEGMGFTLDDVRDAFFQGWPEDERNKVLMGGPTRAAAADRSQAEGRAKR